MSVWLTPTASALWDNRAMPIIVEEEKPIPLRGYVVYQDDLAKISKKVGSPVRVRVGTNGDLGWRDIDPEHLDLLARNDVDGFEISGPKGAFTLFRQDAPLGLGKRGDAFVTAPNDSIRAAIDITSPLEKLSKVRWGMRGQPYGCKFIPNTRDDYLVHRRRFMTATVVGLAAVIVGVLTLVLTVSLG